MYYNFYVARATYLAAIIDTLDSMNACTDRLITEVGLSRAHAEHADSLILQYPIWKLLDKASNELDVKNLGKTIAAFFCHNFFKDKDRIEKNYPHIQNILSYFVDQGNLITNAPSFWLKEDENHIWLCRTGTPGIDVGEWQMEQFVVSFLVGVFNYYLGAKWQPAHIKLKLTDKEQLQNIWDFNNCSFKIGNRYTAIAIEKHLIDKPSIQSLITKSSATEPQIPKDLKTLILKLLEQNYFGDNPSAQDIANISHINIRKLQRNLKQYKTDLKTLLEIDKKNRAHDLLINSNSPISDISKTLGYNDKANFSRAFKRWFKVPPLVYRQTH